MSVSPGHVKGIRFALVVVGSAALHGLLLAVAVLFDRELETERLAVASTEAKVVHGALSSDSDAMQMVGVALEAPVAMEQTQRAPSAAPGEAARVTQPNPVATRAEPAEAARRWRPAAPRPAEDSSTAAQKRRAEGVPNAPSAPSIDVSSTSSIDVSSTAPPVTRDVLKRAMQASAAQASAASATAYVAPSVRVDPNETDLDRAWPRSFAWAFATDRSFFGEPPIGTARFVLELAPNGSIKKVHWLPPEAPARLKELVLRMVKLLARNRFNAPSPETQQPWLRGFEMKVSERHVAVPTQASATRAEAGDLSMLGAGESVKSGQISHPMVADMTGHQLDCALRLIEPRVVDSPQSLSAH